jgi:hypothetical protein
MNVRMTQILRFWVDCEYQRIKNHAAGRPRTELMSQILREFEESGDAMRYVNTKSEIAWKATYEMLSRLADANPPMSLLGRFYDLTAVSKLLI